ncbi:hypothetical protein R6Q59_015652 [Mikania micrantha]
MNMIYMDLLWVKELESCFWKNLSMLRRKVLDSADLKRSSISFFDIDKHESAVSRWARARTKAAMVGKGLSKNCKAQKLALQHWLEASEDYIEHSDREISDAGIHGEALFGKSMLEVKVGKVQRNIQVVPLSGNIFNFAVIRSIGSDLIAHNLFASELFCLTMIITKQYRCIHSVSCANEVIHEEVVKLLYLVREIGRKDVASEIEKYVEEEEARGR